MFKSEDCQSWCMPVLLIVSRVWYWGRCGMHKNLLGVLLQFLTESDTVDFQSGGKYYVNSENKYFKKWSCEKDMWEEEVIIWSHE